MGAHRLCDHLDTPSHQESPEGHINMQLFMVHEIKPLLLIHYTEEFPQTPPNSYCFWDAALIVDITRSLVEK